MAHRNFSTFLAQYTHLRIREIFPPQLSTDFFLSHAHQLARNLSRRVRHTSDTNTLSRDSQQNNLCKITQKTRRTTAFCDRHWMTESESDSIERGGDPKETIKRHDSETHVCWRDKGTLLLSRKSLFASKSRTQSQSTSSSSSSKGEWNFGLDWCVRQFFRGRYPTTVVVDSRESRDPIYLKTQQKQ